MDIVMIEAAAGMLTGMVGGSYLDHRVYRVEERRIQKLIEPARAVSIMDRAKTNIEIVLANLGGIAAGLGSLLFDYDPGTAISAGTTAAFGVFAGLRIGSTFSRALDIYCPRRLRSPDYQPRLDQAA
jgi:hypothetical protein